MRETFEYIKTQVDTNRVYEEGGLQVFDGIVELQEEFGITLEGVKEHTNWIDFDFDALNQPFVLYDCNGSFTFLTSTAASEVQKFIDHINAK